MRFALITRDRAGALAVRQSNRDAHLAYIDETGAVEMAGPFLNDSGEMCGSLIILNVPDRAAAEEWAANDPYAKADLFEDVSLQEWKKVVG